MGCHRNGFLSRRTPRDESPRVPHCLAGLYDAHQKTPLSGERSHFAEGITEYYAELLGMSRCQALIEFMKLLAKKNRPKGHEICPCGSSVRLRNCHRDLLYNTRENVAWQYVAEDLQTILLDDQLKYSLDQNVIIDKI